MNTAPYEIPQRIEKINELIVSLAICGAKIDTIKTDPGETNATLAMCEIAMSLPPVWFAHPERLLIVQIVSVLYGDPQKFIRDIADGTVSFYARMEEDCRNDPTIGRGIPTLEQIIVEANQLHIKQFGVW